MELTSSIFLLLLFINLNFCLCIEVITGTAAAVAAVVSGTAYYLNCKTNECCTDDWIRFDESRLEAELKQRLFGQHLAEFTVRRSLHGFFSNKNPKKPLVMSFNGLTGSGKNFVANLIANSTYWKGTGSSYVHLYNALRDFPHKQRVSEYQDRLRSQIVEFTKKCDRSLFIFDEVDKMPPGTLDALKPFVDYYENIGGTDYRKNIYIFLSNAGSKSIVGLSLQFWADGQQREEMSLRDLEPIINKGAFNEHGGFQFSELLRSELVDVFVPFLPLERRHIRECIEAEIKRRGVPYNNALIDNVLNDLVYFPPETELYSKSGCKRIEQKLDYYLF